MFTSILNLEQGLTILDGVVCCMSALGLGLIIGMVLSKTWVLLSQLYCHTGTAARSCAVCHHDGQW